MCQKSIYEAFIGSKFQFDHVEIDQDGCKEKVDEGTSGYQKGRAEVLQRCAGRRAKHFSVARTTRA